MNDEPLTPAQARQGWERLGLGVAISALGFALHNAVEFGWRDLFDLENGLLLFVGAQVVMVILYRWRPRSMAGGLMASGIVQVLGGAILSILPLAFLPYDPAQTPTHYAMHGLLAVTQIPLIVAGWKLQRRR